MNNDLKELQKVIKDIYKKVSKSLKKRNIPTQIGDMSEEMVRTRTRKGYGVDKNEGKQQRLPKLRPFTKKLRKDLKKKGKLDNRTTPNKSNFTRTGKSLDNIKVKPGNSKVGLELDNHGKKAVKTTEKLGKRYNFMTLSKSETKRVQKLIEAEIEKVLKKYL